jgi:hypothetical protein
MINTAKKIIDPIRNEVCSYRVTFVNVNKIYYVPLDPANRHYNAILEWVAEGNTIEEAD